ncbi:MAG: TIR domain-containing protein [Xanthobacteraceae bacterium]
MKVFISWSGELSKQLAHAFRTWLPRMLQSVKPYFSPSDVEKGSKWDNEISKELEQSSFGIIAMTREALKSQWISFEAGALSKQVDKSRLCAICFDLEPTDIQGPLSRFQAAKFNRQEISQLVSDINSSAGEAKLTESDLDASFQVWWPQLESEITGILELHVPPDRPEVRTERQLIEETLLIVRGMQGVNEKVSTLSNAFVTLARTLAGNRLDNSWWRRSVGLSSEATTALRDPKDPKRIARIIDVVVTPEEDNHSSIIESITHLLPGAKIEPRERDEMTIRFRATDAEVDKFVVALKSIQGILEVDRRLSF